MKLYVIHHSHTDIGYTDLQEKIVYTHIDYIWQVVKTVHEALGEPRSCAGAHLQSNILPDASI